MSDLFNIPECKSPRLLWMERHQIETSYSAQCAEWKAKKADSIAWGESEEIALANLAAKLGIRLWNEEGRP